MRVTFVLPFVNLTGGVRMVLDVANGLHERGHTVCVAYPTWPYRFHLARVDQMREWWRELRRPARVEWLELRAPLKRVPWVHSRWLPEADAVVATSWPTAFGVARLEARHGRKFHWLMHHEAGTGPEQRIVDVYRLPLTRITLSTRVQQEVMSRFSCPVPHVVPAGVDLSRFFVDGPRDLRTVLMLYHPGPLKGASEGAEALSRVRTQFPDTRIEWCGPIRPPRLMDGTVFVHAPSDAALRRSYSRATCLLYPSRYEGFGLPPLEAMACGCPVVSTRVGAVSEYAVHDESALLAAPGDVGQLASHVALLLSDAERRDRLSRQGLDVARRFTVELSTDRFERVLIETLARVP